MERVLYKVLLITSWELIIPQMCKVRGEAEDSGVKEFSYYLRTDKHDTQEGPMFQSEFESWKRQSRRRKVATTWEGWVSVANPSFQLMDVSPVILSESYTVIETCIKMLKSLSGYTIEKSQIKLLQFLIQLCTYTTFISFPDF